MNDWKLKTRRKMELNLREYFHYLCVFITKVLFVKPESSIDMKLKLPIFKYIFDLGTHLISLRKYLKQHYKYSLKLAKSLFSGFSFLNNFELFFRISLNHDITVTGNFSGIDFIDNNRSKKPRMITMALHFLIFLV